MYPCTRPRLGCSSCWPRPPSPAASLGLAFTPTEQNGRGIHCKRNAFVMPSRWVVHSVCRQLPTTNLFAHRFQTLLGADRGGMVVSKLLSANLEGLLQQRKCLQVLLLEKVEMDGPHAEILSRSTDRSKAPSLDKRTVICGS